MADAGRELAATPSAVRELADERQLVREGYDFLDEKRLLLAAELLREQARFDDMMRAHGALEDAARAALLASVTRHGLNGLQVYPPLSLDDARVTARTRSFLGVPLSDAELRGPQDLPPEAAASGPEPAWQASPLASPLAAPHASPQADSCRDLFRALIRSAASLAAVSGNIHRMVAEYRRTQRRARALEDVLLPEIESALREMSARIEDDEREETLRTRLEYGR